VKGKALMMLVVALCATGGQGLARGQNPPRP